MTSAGAISSTSCSSSSSSSSSSNSTSSSSSDDDSSSASSSSSRSSIPETTPLSSSHANEPRTLTAAEIMRNKLDPTRNRVKEDSSHNRNEEEDLDEQIRRLEEELNRDDDGNSFGSSQSVSSDEGDAEKPNNEGMILSLSQSKDARIDSLPSSLLPSISRKHPRGDNPTEDGARSKNKRKKLKQNHSEADNPVSEGLKAAVKELLDGYKPRSAEKLSLYCRVCAKQFDTLEAFHGHKTQEFHKTAAAMERKASYCNLCRKQLTSPAQLQEHLQARPHKERLQYLRSKQQQRGRSPPPRRRAGSFRPR